MSTQFGLQPLQKVQLAIPFHTVALAGSTTHRQQFGIRKSGLPTSKRRRAVHHASKKFKVNALGLACREGTKVLTISDNLSNKQGIMTNDMSQCEHITF